LDEIADRRPKALTAQYDRPSGHLRLLGWGALMRPIPGPGLVRPNVTVTTDRGRRLLPDFANGDRVQRWQQWHGQSVDSPGYVGV